MLRGHVFKFHTFANEAFAHFIDTFLEGNMGITKGCELSNTNNSVTIGAGYFCIKGRFLEIVGTETISNISDNGYYSLVCEIDLTKINTKAELNQATIKLVKGTSEYPTLTREDLINDGNVYQFEFARFKVVNSAITDFTDRRTFLNFDSIYSNINSRFSVLLDQLIEEMTGVQDRTGLMLADDIQIISGTTQLTTQSQGKYESPFIGIEYPTGFNKDNTYIIAFKCQDMVWAMDDHGHRYASQNNGEYTFSENIYNAISYNAEMTEYRIDVKLASKRSTSSLKYWFILLRR